MVMLERLLPTILIILFDLELQKLIQTGHCEAPALDT